MYINVIASELFPFVDIGDTVDARHPATIWIVQTTGTMDLVTVKHVSRVLIRDVIMYGKIHVLLR